MNLCEFGSCKRKQKVEIVMHNLATKEKSSTKVCGEHSKSVLDSCYRHGIYTQMIVLREGKAVQS